MFKTFPVMVFLMATALAWATATAQLHVRGKVLDEQTGKPIAAFRILPGTTTEVDDQSQPVQWMRVNAQKFTDGAYDFVPATMGLFSDDNPIPVSVVLRVEADGYEPAVSSTIAPDPKDQTYDFKLKGGKNITGALLTPDGQPAANARLLLVMPGQWDEIQLGAHGNNPQFLQTTSDAQGKFSFFPQTGKYAVLVLHDSGWAQFDQNAQGQTDNLKLQPWGRIQGLAMLGSKPFAKGQVVLQPSTGPQDAATPYVRMVDQRSADKQGKFTFDRVPAGPFTLSRISPNGQPAVIEPVNVPPGQSVAVQLGGKGQIVIGHLAKAGDEKPSWAQCQASLNRQPTPAALSAELLAVAKKMQHAMADTETSLKQKQTWMTQWSDTPEGKAFNKEMNAYRQSMYQQTSQLALTIAADGTFRAEDVPAGDYELMVYQFKTSGDGSGTICGQLQQQVTVAGHSDQPMDLGELHLVAASQGAASEASPVAFETKTWDGRTFKLADQRGKYVLLDLWATWTPLSDTRLAALTDVYAAFGQDKKLVMIGLGAGETAQVKQFAQQHPMPWLQAGLDDAAAMALGQTLGAGSLPAVVLIGPDGKVISANLRGPGIRAAVQAALNTP